MSAQATAPATGSIESEVASQPACWRRAAGMAAAGVVDAAPAGESGLVSAANEMLAERSAQAANSRGSGSFFMS